MVARAIQVVTCLALLVGGAAIPSLAQLQGENLLVALPPGFKVGAQGSRNDMNMQEWIPQGETVENWSEMVTVQVFKRRDLEPGPYLKDMQAMWSRACPNSSATSITVGKVNGYAMATVMLQCPLLASTGKPETTVFKAIKGNDSFYLVQRATRSAATPDQLQRAKQYIDGITVCDTRRPAQPCKMP